MGVTETLQPKDLLQASKYEVLANLQDIQGKRLGHQIVDDIVNGPTEYVFFIGLPGSGKTTAREQLTHLLLNNNFSVAEALFDTALHVTRSELVNQPGGESYHDLRNWSPHDWEVTTQRYRLAIASLSRIGQSTNNRKIIKISEGPVFRGGKYHLEGDRIIYTASGNNRGTTAFFDFLTYAKSNNLYTDIYVFLQDPQVRIASIYLRNRISQLMHSERTDDVQAALTKTYDVIVPDEFKTKEGTKFVAQTILRSAPAEAITRLHEELYQAGKSLVTVTQASHLLEPPFAEQLSTEELQEEALIIHHIQQQLEEAYLSDGQNNIRFRYVYNQYLRGPIHWFPRS